MKESHVLASCIKSREAFDSIQKHVTDEDFTEQGNVIWGGVCDYYDTDSSAQKIDGEILGRAIARSVTADKHKQMFINLVNGLTEFEASPQNIVMDLIETKRERLKNQLAAALLAGEEAGELLEAYDEILHTTELTDDEEEEDARQGFSVMDLVDVDFNRDNLVRVYPESLNERLDGGVKPGHHLIVFARPEMGKTMLIIEMMAGFARQGLITLYIGNEDPIADINMRVVNRLSGMPKLEVINAPQRADDEVRKHGYENLILKSLAPGTTREITQLIEKYKPDVLVLDQLRNLNMKQDNYVLALEQAAKQGRQWAKRYSCVVVSVTQAGDSAEGKGVLSMGDVDYSNTGIPSQADVMIGMGANANQLNAGERILSLPKNKVSGKHEYFAVSVEPHLSKVIPLG
jgi:KaiC/GvpD/RAD55 family RecA-like ATPase